MNNKKIIVFGGTGYYGRRIVAHLVTMKEPVRVLSRNAAKARDILDPEVEIMEGDVTDHPLVVESLKGVKAMVICLSAVNFQLIRKRQQIERDAVLDILSEGWKAGIKRLVYVSGYEMRPSVLKALKIPDFGAIMLEIESKIRQSDYHWTILGAAPSFELFFAFFRKGKMAVPGGGKNAIPSIAPQDVGAIVAQTVVREDLNGQRIRMTGPEAYTFTEVAKIFGAATGREVKHVTLPLGVINLVSLIAYPVSPFPRFLFKSLKLLNNFPQDLAQQVPTDHQLLKTWFDYEPLTLEAEIRKRFMSDNPGKPLLY